MTHVYNTEEGQAKASDRSSAYQAAIKILIANHPDEWEQIHGDEREARGLPRQPQPTGLVQRIIRQEARIRELEQQLAAQATSNGSG